MSTREQQKIKRAKAAQAYKDLVKSQKDRAAEQTKLYNAQKQQKQKALDDALNAAIQAKFEADRAFEEAKKAVKKSIRMQKKITKQAIDMPPPDRVPPQERAVRKPRPANVAPEKPVKVESDKQKAMALAKSMNIKLSDVKDWKGVLTELRAERSFDKVLNHFEEQTTVRSKSNRSLALTWIN